MVSRARLGTPLHLSACLGSLVLNTYILGTAEAPIRLEAGGTSSPPLHLEERSCLPLPSLVISLNLCTVTGHGANSREWDSGWQAGKGHLVSLSPFQPSGLTVAGLWPRG